MALDVRHRAPETEPDRQQQSREVAIVIVRPGIGAAHAVDHAPRAADHGQQRGHGDAKLKSALGGKQNGHLCATPAHIDRIETHQRRRRDASNWMRMCMRVSGQTPCEAWSSACYL